MPSRNQVMEVRRRPDNALILWESTETFVPSLQNGCVLKTPPELPVSSPDLRSTVTPSLQRPSQLTTGDVINELLEEFQRGWMTLRPNGRIQSSTIWRNGMNTFMSNICLPSVFSNVVKLSTVLYTE